MLVTKSEFSQDRVAVGALTFLCYVSNLFVHVFYMEPRLTCNQKTAVNGGSGLAVV